MKTTINKIASYFLSFSLRKQVLSIVSFSFLLVIVVTVILTAISLSKSEQMKISSMGQLLAKQTATSATDLIISGDKLGLTALLNQLVNTPFVIKASVYSVDGQKMAGATAKAENSESSDVFSSSIVDQDMTAGYVELQLNTQLLVENHYVFIVVILLLNLFVCCLFWLFFYSYAYWLTKNIKLIEHYIVNILKTPVVASSTIKNEITQLITYFKNHTELNASQSKIKKNEVIPPLIVENSEAQRSESLIVCIRSNNLTFLKKALYSQTFIEILYTQTKAFNEAAKVYQGEVSYSPEGNCYVKFSSKNNTIFVHDAIRFCWLIYALSARLAKHLPAEIFVSIGLTIADEMNNFPKNQSPNEKDSAASLALWLAGLLHGGVYLAKTQLKYLPSCYSNAENNVEIMKGIISLKQASDEDKVKIDTLATQILQDLSII